MGRRRGNALARLYRESSKPEKRVNPPAPSSEETSTLESLTKNVDFNDKSLQSMYPAIVARFGISVPSSDPQQSGAEVNNLDFRHSEQGELYEQVHTIPVEETANLDNSISGYTQPTAHETDVDPITQPKAQSSIDQYETKGSQEPEESDNGSKASQKRSLEDVAISSSRKMRKTLPLATLKAQAPRPDLVDWFDADARDPLFLVKLRSTPGVVQVPQNWRARTESSIFRRSSHASSDSYKLPESIAATGINTMRDVVKDGPESASVRQRTREQIQPRLGRLDLDFRKLHAAFFKNSPKPRLLGYGQIWAGNNSGTPVSESILSRLRPGQLTDQLRRALGLKPGDAPPWATALKKKPSPYYAGSIPVKLPDLWGEIELEDEDNDDSVEDIKPGQATELEINEHDMAAKSPTDNEQEIDDRIQYHHRPKEDLHNVEGISDEVPLEPSTDEEDANTKPLYRELVQSKTEGPLGPTHKYTI